MSHTPASAAASAPSAEFWKRKLAAFLHDSPSKALGIKDHEDRAEAAFKRAGLEDYIKNYDFSADHAAAAADRIPFPRGKIRCEFDGIENRFHHPLDGTHQLPKERNTLQVRDAEETEQALQPLLEIPSDWEEGPRWRAAFFAHWRLWRRNCAEHSPALGFLPADTRLPDHTIWHHMGVVSALAATRGKPALLKFQLGPVQDFIAAARSTRDLWSGSYLLSWLMATGMAALAREVGPDSVIFPNLYGQPLIDLRFRDELWDRIHISHQSKSMTAWESIDHKNPELLTPNLPNVFLALVPSARALELALLVETAVRAEWLAIATSVHEFAKPIITTEHSPKNASDRFFSQIARHLDIAWQTTPWPATPDEALALARNFLPPAEEGTSNPVCARLNEFITYFTQTMPVQDRDARYYTDANKTKLNNIGMAWSVLVALNSWQLDATRQTRTFTAWSSGGWEGRSSHNAKDALNGREEMIVGGTAWQNALTGNWKGLFRHSDEIGATTLVKRLWHLAYLEKAPWSLPASPQRGFQMPNTQEIAEYLNKENEGTQADPSDEKAPYFAVLALDGDSIGKIVSGDLTPSLGAQLADYGEGANRKGARMYFETNKGEQLLASRRPISPGFHLQFSEALGNFALQCVRPIIEAHQGKLLYAGGDDVLAMLPASEALVCADALQRAFRGEAPQRDAYQLQQIAPGFLARTDRVRSEKGALIPFIVPGPACTASVGVAIAKAKAPLQDVIRAAQAAEKRAKKIDGKHAIAVTIMKGSGEITEWAGRFGTDLDSERKGSSGLSAVWWLLYAINDAEILSRKFPHRLIQLLEPYCSPGGANGKGAIQDLSQKDFDLPRIVSIELRIALERQRGANWDQTDRKIREETVNRIDQALQSYLESTCGSLGNPQSVTERLRQLIGLLTVTAFLLRQSD